MVPSTNSRLFSTIVEYKCRPGYYVNPNTPAQYNALWIECRETKIWNFTGSIPDCARKRLLSTTALRGFIPAFLVANSDVNKDWPCKDKDKDQAYKDQDKDKDKDLNLVLKESLRTTTSLTVTYWQLQLNLQSLSSNNNEHKVIVGKRRSGSTPALLT